MFGNFREIKREATKGKLRPRLPPPSLTPFFFFFVDDASLLVSVDFIWLIVNLSLKLCIVHQCMN